MRVFRVRVIGVGLMSLAALCGCERGESPSPVDAPGADTTAKTDALDAGAAMLQSEGPLEALNAYMDGFHFYNGTWQRKWRPITTAAFSMRTLHNASSLMETRRTPK